MKYSCYALPLLGLACGYSSNALAQRVSPFAQQSADDDIAQMAYAQRMDWTRHVAVATGQAAGTEPSIVSGKVVTPKINVHGAPGIPELEVTIDSGSVGAYAVTANMASPSHNHGVYSRTILSSYPGQPTTTMVRFQVVSPFYNSTFGGYHSSETETFGPYTEAGVWNLTGLSLIAKDGSVISYGSEDLQALFPNSTVAVVNPSQDISAPVIGVGQVLTPTVNLSGATPYFAVKLHVSDSASGIQNVSVGSYGPAGDTQYLEADSALTAPLKSGDVIAYVSLPANAPTGTYRIGFISVCDVAFNCSEISASNVAKAIGASSFQVVN